MTHKKPVWWPITRDLWLHTHGDNKHRNEHEVIEHLHGTPLLRRTYQGDALNEQPRYYINLEHPECQTILNQRGFPPIMKHMPTT